MVQSNGTTVHIAQRNVDTARPMKVVIVGAGISGIISAIKLLDSIQHLDITIYDKNEGLGGTWYENRYPGCACGMFVWLSNVLQRRRRLMKAFRYSRAHISAFMGPQCCVVSVLRHCWRDLEVLATCCCKIRPGEVHEVFPPRHRSAMGRVCDKMGRHRPRR